jgi:ABC-type transport system involved in multi-copper enzyme maturation permease subunit
MDDNTPTKPMSRKEIIASLVIIGIIAVVIMLCLGAGFLVPTT